MYLLLILVLAHMGSCSVNMGKELEGKIIHVESLEHRGYWLDACFTLFAYARGSDERDVYFNSWSQFKVIDCGSGTVCLESIRYPRRYLKPEWSWWVGITKSHHPQSEPKCKWVITCRDTSMDECWFHSKYPNYDNLYLTMEDKNDWVEVERKNPNAFPKISLFRILAPKPSERYIVLQQLRNEGPKDLQYSVEYRYGIEKSTTISNTFRIDVNVGLEVECAFTTTGSLGLSYEWKKVKKDTFRESVKRTLEITVPPFSIYTVKVLAGEYGPFIVKSKSVKIECVRLRTGKKCNGDNAGVNNQ